MAKNKLFSWLSFMITIKALVVSVIIGIISWIGVFLINLLGNVGYVVSFLVMVLSLWLFGFLANRLWGWK